MPEPIEITAKDIIKRPLLDIVTKGASAANKSGMMQQIKEGLTQFKEIKKTLDELGIEINLGDILGMGKKGKENKGGLPAAPPNYEGPRDAQPPAQARGIQQIKNFIKLLQLRYGDITVDETLEQLKKEFGPVKLSEFTDLFKEK